MRTPNGHDGYVGHHGDEPGGGTCPDIPPAPQDITPDFVHVLAQGRIVKSGGKDLALRLEGSPGWGYGEQGPALSGHARLLP